MFVSKINKSSQSNLFFNNDICFRLMSLGLLLFLVIQIFQEILFFPSTVYAETTSANNSMLPWQSALQGGLKEISCGNKQKGENLLKEALKLSENNFFDHAQVILVMADRYRLQSRLLESESLYKQLLASIVNKKNDFNSSSKNFELKDKNVSKDFTTLDQLEIIVNSKIAGLYKQEARYGESESIYLKVLSEIEKKAEKNLVDLAVAQANLGQLYQQMGKIKEAHAYIEKALLALKKERGIESLEVAQCYFDLASLNLLDRKFKDAETNFQLALTVFEKNLKDNDLRIATCADSLGSVLYAEHKYSEAEAMARKALKIYEKMFAPDNTELAITLSNLGLRLLAQGKNNEAFECFNKSLLIQEKKNLGVNSLQSIQNLQGLAQIYVSRTEYKQAELLLRKILAIKEKNYGKNHLALISTLKNLANCLILEKVANNEPSEFMQRAMGILDSVPRNKRKTVEELISEECLKGLDLASQQINFKDR